MAGPRALWMGKITDKDPQFWENIEQEFQKAKTILQDGFMNLMGQTNQAPGLHVLQVMRGCELHEDGSGSWFQRLAFDGQNLTTATDPASDTQKQKACIESLKHFLQIGEESLLRTVTPQTMVSQRKSGSHTFLIGYAYGFYPREIEVKWVRDGVEIPWESKELLPNPDGTFQVRTKVEVQEGDDVRSYEYHVIHSSLPVTVIATVEYDPPGRSWQGRLLLLMASLMTAVLVGAVFFWKSLKGLFTTGCTAQRSNEDQPSGGGNEREEMEISAKGRSTVTQLGPA
ncbi:saoe class I histocompatibility antigen, A alpha chain-like isoform X2 [Lissotriton helveticus]